MKFRLILYSSLVVFLAVALTVFMLVVREAEKPATTISETPSASAAKGQITVGTLAIMDAFARPTALESYQSADPNVTAGKVSGVYMTITNMGQQADRLVKVESDIAGLTELHETTITNDVAKMRPLQGGIVIPAGSTVKLSTGGIHLMLTQLKREVVLGQTIRVTLTFESGAVITLDVPVLMG